MSPEERASLLLLNLKINELIFTHPKVLSRPLDPWVKLPDDMLTPALIRAFVRSHVDGLDRAKQLEEHVVARLRLNGVSFLDWERDPSKILGGVDCEIPLN